MKLHKIRILVQVLFFLFLIYGAYFGLRFENFIPTWRCQNQVSYSEGCYLLPLQRLQYGLKIYPEGFRGMPLPGYVVLWGKWSAYLRFFLTLIIFIIIFNKLWCGWICPFGTFQDGVNFISRKMRVKEINLSYKFKRALNFIKYICLFAFFYALVIFLLGLPIDAPLFCKICPVKSILSIFDRNLLNFSIIYPMHTISTALTCILTGFILIWLVFKKRFFCFICPVGLFIDIFRKISLPGMEKNISTCTACGKCYKACPMDIKEIYSENKDKDIFKENCILCLKCVESCPQKATLLFKYQPKKIYGFLKDFLSGFFKNKS